MNSKELTYGGVDGDAAADEDEAEGAPTGISKKRQFRRFLLARRIAHIPTWLFHGDADSTVPVDESRKMAAALKAAGANVQYTEFPGVNHDAWTPAYARPDVYEWLLRQKRAGRDRTDASG